MPRTEEQFKEIREQKRAHIVESAIELFAEKGFDATSISMIATRAAISKGLIYNYFDSKEALIKEILIKGFSEFMVEFDANKDGVLTEEEFIYFIDSSLNIMKDNIHYWRLYFMVMAQPKVMELVFDELMAMLAPFMDTMTNFFESKGCSEPIARARLFGAVMDGLSLNFIMDPEGFPIEETKKILIDMFLNK